MARYATTEKQYDCPSPTCEVRFTEREAIVIRKTHLVCPKCYADMLPMHEGPLYALRENARGQFLSLWQKGKLNG